MTHCRYAAAGRLDRTHSYPPRVPVYPRPSHPLGLLHGRHSLPFSMVCSNGIVVVPASVPGTQAALARERARSAAIVEALRSEARAMDEQAAAKLAEQASAAELSWRGSGRVHGWKDC